MTHFPNATCPVCLHLGADLFHRYQNRIDTVRCPTCRTIYMYPLPDQSQLTAMYDNAYAGATDGYFSKTDKKLRRSRGRVQMLKRLTGLRPAPSQPVRFLDLGCNGGFMSHAAHQVGFTVTGIDLDPVSIAYAKQHHADCDFHVMRAEDLAKTGQQFNLIYCSEVIEHVADIQGFLTALRALLAPNGWVMITTPDITHWRVPRMIEQWDAFGPPAHCVYFNPNSMQGALARHGMTVRKKMLALKPGIKVIAQAAA